MLGAAAASFTDVAFDVHLVDFLDYFAGNKEKLDRLFDAAPLQRDHFTDRTSLLKFWGLANYFRV